MSAMAVLIPVGIAMGAVGLAVFFWSLRTGQYEDMDGAAERILGDDEDEP
jgi:cbb3-type cytochrome oxidase maturation protein